MNRIRGIQYLAIVVVMLLSMSRVDAAYTVDCTFGDEGDNIDRGFYVSNYPGTSLDQVGLSHKASSVAGERTITLTARLDTFDGTFLGVASATRTIATSHSLTIFDFGHIPVPAGSRITFKQAVIAGDSSVL
ncbi:MAG: hypothetical protein ABI585_12825, partial [Betaproteobacteria bacterium]